MTTPGDRFEQEARPICDSLTGNVCHANEHRVDGCYFTGHETRGCDAQYCICPSLAAALRSADANAREEQRREDCAAVCAVCALGSVPIRYEAWCGTGDWRHVNMPLLVECMAGQIHERTHAAESARGGECTHDR